MEFGRGSGGRTTMTNIDDTQSDRSVGSTLSGDDVETLREGVHWARTHHGVRYRDVAEESGTPEHTVRNFANRKSLRPDNAFLGRLYRFFAANRHLSTRQPHEPASRIAQGDLIRAVLPVSDEDVKRVLDRFSGYYLCFRRAYRRSMLSASWLHIMKEASPLPRFTHFVQYPDPVDQSPRSYVIVGYAISRKGRIYLSGHNDAEIKHYILNEPRTRSFTYLQGLCLMTSADDGTPFATRIICQHLGADALRDQWMGKIGMFSDKEFGSLFDNADVIIKSLGDGQMITVAEHR